MLMHLLRSCVSEGGGGREGREGSTQAGRASGLLSSVKQCLIWLALA